MKILFRYALFFGFATAFGNPAPNFDWDGAGSKLTSLKSVRGGSSVCLLVAKSPKDKAFREQVKKLEELYQEFASRKVVFAAAFFEDAGGRIPSDIPFAVASNGQQVIADYGVKDSFNIIVIGPDGNIDMQSNKVIPATRLRDLVISTFAVQNEERPAPAPAEEHR